MSIPVSNTSFRWMELQKLGRERLCSCCRKSEEKRPLTSWGQSCSWVIWFGVEFVKQWALKGTQIYKYCPHLQLPDHYPKWKASFVSRRKNRNFPRYVEGQYCWNVGRGLRVACVKSSAFVEWSAKISGKRNVPILGIYR